MTLISELRRDASALAAHIKAHRYRVLLALCVALLCVVPLLFSVVGTGHDYGYHLGRLRCLADNIQHGKWFSAVYHSGLYDAGYASPAFYGDLFLHIPAVLVCLGLKEEPAMRVFYMLVTAACAMSAFWCAKKAFKDERAAFLTSLCYTFSGYFCTDMLARAAIGEMQSFVFLPPVLYGFYNIVFGDRRHWYCLPLGLAGCLVSHLLTSAVAVILLFVFALVFAVRIFKEKQRLFALIKSAGLFLCVSAFFLFPLLEQLTNAEYVATNGMSATRWGTLARRAMPWSSVFSDFCLGSARTGLWIPNGIGLFPVAAAVFAGINIFKSKHVSRTGAAFCGMGVFTLFVISDLFPWKSFQSLAGGMQFPWRLMVFATLFFAVFAGVTVKNAKGKWLSAACVAVVATCSLFSFFSAASPSYSKMLKNAQTGTITTPSRTYIGAGEYLPVDENTFALDKKGEQADAGTLVTGIKSVFNKNSKKAFSNNLDQSALVLKRGYGELTVEFSGNSASDTYIDLPLVNYKGYAAYLDGTVLRTGNGTLISDATVDKKTYTVTYSGAVRVYIGNVESGTVTIRYEGTAVQKISKIITLFTLVCAVCVFIRKKVRSRSQANTPAA